MKKGLVVVVSGYSGVGKGTVIEMVLDAMPAMRFSISCTTRAPRKGEEDGVNYYFLTEEEFDKKVEENAFIEYTRTFTYHYGTLKSEVEKYLNAGVDVLLELNVVGAANVKKLYPKDCVTIFVTPPSLEALKARLIGRGSETEETLARRLKEIENESKEIDKYDYRLVNDVAKRCADEIIDILNAEHLKRKKTKNIFSNPED